MLKRKFNRKALIFIVTLAMVVMGITALVPNDNQVIAMSSNPVDSTSKTITILQTGDIHANIYPWKYKTGEEDDDVGLAKVHTIVKEVRQENPNTILVDSGDTIQGTTLGDIFKDRRDMTHPMMKVMNHMKYDTWVLGNHEFNFGLPTLKNIISDAKFPVLSANITYKEDNSSFVKPYNIKNIDGLKIGILGLTTPNIPQWDGDKVTSLEFAGMSATAKKYIPKMKAEGADLIIAVTHAGLEGRYHETGGDKVRKVAEENPEIAAIFAGHDHEPVKERVNGVLVMAPEDKGHQVSRVDLKLSKKDGEWGIINQEATLLETKEVEASEEILELAEEYHQETVDYVNTPIGTATGDFTPENEIKGIPAAQIQDTALVDLINRVQLHYTDADISSAALFDSYAHIDEGPVSIKAATLIYKYPNTLYTVEMTGKELKEYMEWSAAYFNTYESGDVTISFDPEIRGYNYDMFAGVEYKIDISKPVGERIIDLTFESNPVKDDQSFTVAVNNYRYGGLKSMGMISNDASFKSEKSIQQYIIEYVKEQEVIKPVVDHNWEIIGADLSHPARDRIVQLINAGVIEIPTQNRSWNAESINANDPKIKDAIKN